MAVSPASAYTLQAAQQVSPVAATDPSIQEWANTVVNLTRGDEDIAVPADGLASFGTAANALGPSDAVYNDLNAQNHVVSLGDGGSMTLSFAQPIANGPGADFAVYENGFNVSANADFLELATVSVSSDGVHFYTFPSISLTQTTTQVAGGGTLDPANLYNLAGSTLASYGTPFNLDDLSLVAAVNSNLNLNDITEVRVTDVVGSINPAYGTYDDASDPIFNGNYGTINNIINDPFPTPYTSSGFDLDAVGVINIANAVPEPSSIWYLALGLVALIVIPRYLRRRKIGAWMI